MMMGVLPAVQGSIAAGTRSTHARGILRPLTVAAAFVLIGMCGAGSAPHARAATMMAINASGTQGSPAVHAAAAFTLIHIKNFAFGPATLTVTPGQQVTWINDDAVPHTATNARKIWDTGPLQPGGSFSMTFTTPGTYLYNCTVHPFMQATIIVAP